jgi:hypothetical protein
VRLPSLWIGVLHTGYSHHRAGPTVQFSRNDVVTRRSLVARFTLEQSSQAESLRRLALAKTPPGSAGLASRAPSIPGNSLLYKCGHVSA